jgi:hypothetical protein
MTDPDPGPDEIHYAAFGVILLIVAVAIASAMAVGWQ